MKKNISRTQSLLIVIIVLFNILSIFVTDSCAVMRRVNLSYLANNARYISHGRVIDLKSEWDANLSQIITTVKLSVFENIKDKAMNMTSFKIPGGIVGDIGQISSNSPGFALNEQVVVFISNDDSLVANYQGKFLINKGIVVERGLPVDMFLKEIKMTLTNSFFGQGFPRLREKETNFNYASTQFHWCGEDPMEEFFYINANTQDVTNEEAECISAALTWNNSGACFNFSYGGLSNTATAARDGENIIFWGSGLSSPVLAQTTLWYTPSTGCILEVDCEFNDFETWKSNGTDDVDIQTCMLHEFGHYLCLDHSDNTEAIMYAYYQGVRRTLNIDDIAGIKTMYRECDDGDDGDDGGQPSWTPTYQMLLGSEKKLTLLREYRDQVVSVKPNGQYQIDWLYSQSEELLQILNSDSQLLLEGRRLIELNMPEIKNSINRQKSVLQDTEGIKRFMEKIAERGSLKTKIWCYSLNNSLSRCQRTGRIFFGFRVPATSGQDHRVGR